MAWQAPLDSMWVAEAADAEWSATDLMLGDFYQEPPVYRGAALAASYDPLVENFDFDKPGEAFGFASNDHDDHDDLSLPMLAFAGETPVAEEDEFTHFRFPRRSAAPPLPADPAFRLEPGTLYAASASASELANAALDFLRLEATAAIRKVSEKKVAMKADVFVSGVHCAVKIRVYQCSQRLALECQRRSGDCLAFASFFGKLTAYVEAATGASSTSPTLPVAAAPWKPPRPLPGPELAELGPICALAAQRHCPHLQAEAARALCALEASALDQAVFGCENALEAVEALVSSEPLEVALPAALLLRRLCERPGPPAAGLRRLLDAASARTRSGDSPAVLRQQISLALALGASSA